jgi:hypothetical protein
LAVAYDYFVLGRHWLYVVLIGVFTLTVKTSKKALKKIKQSKSE